MSDDERTTAEQLGGSAAAIAAFDAGEEAAPKPVAKKKKKKKKKKVRPSDKARAVTRAAEELARRTQTASVVKRIRIQFEAATRAGNTAKANNLRDRIKAVIAAGE